MADREQPLTHAIAAPIDHGPYDAAQLRIDTWNRIKTVTSQLAEATRPAASSDLRANLFQMTRPTRLSRGTLIDRADLRGATIAAVALLRSLETYWSFPGTRAVDQLGALLEAESYQALAEQAARIERSIAARSQAGREAVEQLDDGAAGRGDSPSRATRPHFEVLLVDDLSAGDEARLKQALLALRSDADPFVYDVVVVASYEDALIGSLFNHHVQACVLRSHFAFRAASLPELLRAYLRLVPRRLLREPGAVDGSMQLARAIKSVRPELDLFWVTDTPVEEAAGHLSDSFRRVFYGQEDLHELHLSILKGVGERYETPFFTALSIYAQRPTGGFHALPVSRGKSVGNSRWIRDFGEFYGTNIFLAETSATSGGLDSLLQPTGPLRRAQQLAARAFGARKTFFVTNGTSTANKIAVQALIAPDDIVLVAKDCHKSHHYALLLVGGRPLYLEPYPLSEYSMYGAIPLATIKRRLLELRRAGKLDRVRMVLLTNCGFDGITYDPVRVMHEILAIKPDMIFLWDEAWFAYAGFLPMLRRRTAMAAAAVLLERYRSEEYRSAYARWRESAPRLEDRDADGEVSFLDGTAMPDPDLARVRVYATHSTHKTLTALRQGSMIHVHDQDYEEDVAESFHEAYMTHTSTSPNYQILASLDVGRRQAELEGYELVQRSLHLAMSFRRRLRSHALLRKYFTVLAPGDMIPAEHRSSGLADFQDRKRAPSALEDAWREDEFVLDPTRITVHIGKTGMDGDTLRRRLMEEFDIQINKTSRNTLLFMIHIGMTRGTVAYLIEVLTRLAEKLDREREEESALDTGLHEKDVLSLTRDLPPLPDFSRFHCAFASEGGTPEGDTRKAFFLAYRFTACEFLALRGPIQAAMNSGREVVSASFVTPYPPGAPLLVPGQVVSPAIIAYLEALDVKEIHGYDPRHGLRVFTEAALEGATLRAERGPGAAPAC